MKAVSHGDASLHELVDRPEIDAHPRQQVEAETFPDGTFLLPGSPHQAQSPTRVWSPCAPARTERNAYVCVELPAPGGAGRRAFDGGSNLSSGSRRNQTSLRPAERMPAGYVTLA